MDIVRHRALGDVLHLFWAWGNDGADLAGSGDEAGEGVISVCREVERVVRVDFERPEVRFLEVHEEAGGEDCCKAV